jgi:predicted RNase H-like HicB family nuclease
MSDNHSNVFCSEEDDGYIADIPDLKSCSAFGRTPDEALREVQLAKKAWLETCRAKREPVPKPRYRPAIYAMSA